MLVDMKSIIYLPSFIFSLKPLLTSSLFIAFIKTKFLKKKKRCFEHFKNQNSVEKLTLKSSYF